MIERQGGWGRERQYRSHPAAARGEQLQEGLRRLRRDHQALGEVRSIGLMTAVDVVSSREPYVLDADRRNSIVQAAYMHGLLLLGCGPSAIRFCPPLCITRDQVVKALDILATVLGVEV